MFTSSSGWLILDSVRSTLFSKSHLVIAGPDSLMSSREANSQDCSPSPLGRM